MSEQDIRWTQRFSNFSKAFHQLEKAIVLDKSRALSDLEKQGLIQGFEFTFELAWKTLRDYLEFKNIEAKFPRDAIKKGFQYDLIDNGDIWIDMLEKRNLMSHTYYETNAKLAYKLITEQFYPQLAIFKEILTKFVHE